MEKEKRASEKREERRSIVRGKERERKRKRERITRKD
jgi:hypothetical protein